MRLDGIDDDADVTGLLFQRRDAITRVVFYASDLARICFIILNTGLKPIVDEDIKFLCN